MTRISENISTYTEYLDEAKTDLQTHVSVKDIHHSDKTVPPTKRTQATFDGKEISNYYLYHFNFLDISYTLLARNPQKKAKGERGKMRKRTKWCAQSAAKYA